MNDTTAMESRLYGGTTPPESPAVEPAAPARSDAEIADSIYRNSTSKPEPKPTQGDASRAELVAMRAQDVERKFYSAEKTYQGVPIDDYLGDVPAEHREAIARETREIYADLSATPTEIQNLAEISRGIRGITQETLNAWDAEVASRHSAEDLALAQRLVARDPVVKQFLRESMLGGHPKFVDAFVEFARRERSKGRLK
jgi:hypothetical protein